MGFEFGIPIDELLARYPLMGWILFIFLLIWVFAKSVGSLIKDIPQVLKLKAIILIPLVEKIKLKKFEKEAIRSDIQGTVNYAVKTISNELPEDAIKKLEISYIEDSEEKNFIKENKIYVRIKPVENQDDNFLNVTRLYLELVLIPNSKPLLSTEQKKAVTYFTTQKIIQNKKKLLKKLHNKYYLPDTLKHKQLKKYFKKITTIDSRGLFFSVALRTIERGADTLLFKEGSLKKEFDNILNHIFDFLENLSEGTLEEQMWKYTRTGTSFSLLLVAAPLKAKISNTQPYVSRLKDNLKHTECIFVVFSKDEWHFGKRVAEAIENYGEVDLLETIQTDKDYREKSNGIIKLYSKKKR